MPQLRMFPTRQRLIGHDTQRLCADDRLIDDFDFLIFNSQTQVCLQLLATAIFGIHGVHKQRPLFAFLALGFIERQIGIHMHIADIAFINSLGRNAPR